MKRVHLLLICLILCVTSMAASNTTADFVQGTPEIKSIGSLALDRGACFLSATRRVGQYSH